MCECCGVELLPDKHHILEFSKGGKTNTNNLICLCPSCHRQLPDMLTEEQQRYLQSWHQGNTENNSSLNHHISANTNQFVLGSNIYKGCSSILTIYNQPVLRVYERESKFYFNAVMLENFHPQMLILGNRIIYPDKDLSIQKSKAQLSIKDGEKTVFDIKKIDDNAFSIEMNFSYKDKYKDKHIPFNFKNTSSDMPGGNFSGCTFRVLKEEQHMHMKAPLVW